MAGWTCPDNQTIEWNGTISVRNNLNVANNGIFGGNVGIGTTNPSTLLHVSGSATTPAIFERSGGSVYSQFKSAGAIKGYIGFINLGTTGIGFLDTAGTTANMLVTDGGNVGIGTTTPQTKFELDATSADADTEIARILQTGLATDGKNVYIRLGKSANAGDGILFGYRYDTTSGDETGWMRIAGDSEPSGLWIRKGGNVGIGTTSPNQLFEVQGTAKISPVTPATNAVAQLLISNDFNHDNAIKTEADHSFQFQNPSGTARITILDAGNVGIGTTSPVQQLHLSGAIGFNSIATPTIGVCSGAIFVSGGILYFASGATAKKIALV